MTQLCAITGPVRDRAGNLLVNQVVTFTYLGGIVGIGAGAIVPEMESATTDGAGNISISLYSGTYRAETRVDRRMVAFRVGVPDATTATLSDCIDQAPAITSDVQAATLAARDSAIAAQTVAENARDTAISVSALSTFPVPFATRAALVSYWTDGKLPDGTILSDGTVQYVAQTGATAISDLPGLVPFGDPSPLHYGQTDVLAVPYVSVASGGMEVAPRLRTLHKPLVIFVSGQSNSELRRAYDWTPATRIRHWSYHGSGKTDSASTTDLGGWTWVAHYNTEDEKVMSWGRAIAEAAAEANPDRPIYLLTVAKGGQSIDQWIDGAADPQMMTAIRNNVPTALTGIQEETGWAVTEIDAFFWWQGESDNGSATWADRFETLVSQLRGESWYPETTPICLSLLGPFGNTGNGWKAHTPQIIRAAANEPELRVVTDPGYLPSSFWVDTGQVHMTADGYRLAGRAAWANFAGAGGLRLFYDFGYDEINDLFSFGDGVPENWEWTFRRNQSGTTTLAVHNTGTGQAQFLGAAPGNQIEFTAFADAGSRLRSTGPSVFDIHADNASGQIRLLTNGTSRIAISASGAVSGASVATQFEPTASKLTTTGYAGMGGYGAGTDASADASDLVTSQRRFTSGTLPFSSGFLHAFHMSKVQNASGAQMGVRAASLSTDRPQFAFRHRADSGTWSAWAEAQPVLATTTAARPTTGLIPGLMVFDTTINKPIWRNAANSGWVDATGTSV